MATMGMVPVAPPAEFQRRAAEEAFRGNPNMYNPPQTMQEYAETSTLPIPGVTSGALPSGMNYERLKRGTPILVPQPPPSPLQQWLAQGNKDRAAPIGFEIGSPVEVCNLTGNDTRVYNNLIGDITQIHLQENNDGTTEMLFDVRIPLRVDLLKNPKMAKDTEASKVPVSPLSESRASMNCQKMYGITLEEARQREEFRVPPYALMYRLSSEKIEPKGARVVKSFESPAAYAEREPIWGGPPPEYRPPMPNQFVAPRMGDSVMPIVDEPAPRQMYARDSYGYGSMSGGLPPSMPVIPSSMQQGYYASGSSRPPPADNPFATMNAGTGPTTIEAAGAMNASGMMGQGSTFDTRAQTFDTMGGTFDTRYGCGGSFDTRR